MGKNTEFPWELLKAECLRVVCTQLVQGSSQDMNNYPLSRKDEMIEFLRDVESRSLDAAVKTLELAPRKTAGGGDEAASPPKRKAVHSEEEINDEEGGDGYNTRFKGIKRVKVREATPEPTSRTPRRVGRPRKSIPSGEGTGSPTRPKGSPQKSAGGSISAGKRGPGRPRKSVPEGAAPADTSIPAVAGEKPAESAAGGEVKEGEPKEGATTDTPAKRGRGRPRKSDVVAPKAPRTPKTPKAASAAKPPALDADGNPKRGRGRPRKSIPETADKPSSKGKQVFDGVLLEKRKSVVEEPSAAEPEVPAAGEAEEEDAVLAAVQNGNNGEGDLSSLGGSNKENEPHDAFRYTPTDHDVDMDADGDPDGEAEPPAAPPVTVV